MVTALRYSLETGMRTSACRHLKVSIIFSCFSLFLGRLEQLYGVELLRNVLVSTSSFLACVTAACS